MFYHYVTRQQILDLDESQASLLPAPTPPVADSPDAASQPTSSFGPEPFVRITVSDYLGGISDVTGEMMRLAIASVGKNLTAKKDGADGQDALSIDNIGNMVREIKGGESRRWADYQEARSDHAATDCRDGRARAATALARKEDGSHGREFEQD